MFHWLHHLFSPHCPDCKEERQESAQCRTCEVLVTQLERSNHERGKLLEQIERMSNPVPTEPEAPSELPEPIQPRVVPWTIRRNLLEAEARKAAELKRVAMKDSSDIEKLEKEVGIDEEVSKVKPESS